VDWTDERIGNSRLRSTLIISPRDHPVFRDRFFFLGDRTRKSDVKDIVWLSPPAVR